METALSLQYEILPGFNYEPTAEQSIELRALATGETAADYAYDFMMRDEGASAMTPPGFSASKIAACWRPDCLLILT